MCQPSYGSGTDENQQSALNICVGCVCHVLCVSAESISTDAMYVSVLSRPPYTRTRPDWIVSALGWGLYLCTRPYRAYVARCSLVVHWSTYLLLTSMQSRPIAATTTSAHHRTPALTGGNECVTMYCVDYCSNELLNRASLGRNDT